MCFYVIFGSVLLIYHNIFIAYRMVKPSIHRESIIHLHKNGLSEREISNRLTVRRNVLYKTIQRFNELGNSGDRSRRGRPPTVLTKTNVKMVADRIRRNPQRSVRKMSREMGISRTSLRRIAGEKLNLYAYKKARCPLLTEATKKRDLTAVGNC